MSSLVPSPPRLPVEEGHVRRSNCLHTAQPSKPPLRSLAVGAEEDVEAPSTSLLQDAGKPPTPPPSAVAGLAFDHIIRRIRGALEAATAATQSLASRLPTDANATGGAAGHTTLPLAHISSSSSNTNSPYGSSRSTMPLLPQSSVDGGDASTSSANADGDTAATSPHTQGAAEYFVSVEGTVMDAAMWGSASRRRSIAAALVAEEGYPLGVQSDVGKGVGHSETIAVAEVAKATEEILATLRVASAALDELSLIHRADAGAATQPAHLRPQAPTGTGAARDTSTGPNDASFVSLVPMTSDQGGGAFASFCALGWQPPSESSGGEGDEGSLQHSRAPSLVPHKTTTILEQGEDETGHKLINDYVILDDLGRGACGSVKLAFSLTRNISVAVKIVRRGRMDGALGMGRKAAIREEALRREIALMKKLRHPNIVQLYEVIDDPTAMKLYLIMKYADLGAVGAVQPDRTCTTLPLYDVVDVAYQCASGLKYLHSLDIVHRDIKPENLFRTSEGRVMIGDFGISGLVADAAKMPSGVGTPHFMAPELHRDAVQRVGNSGSGSGHDSCNGLEDEYRTACLHSSSKDDTPHSVVSGSQAADMWSLGVTLFALAFGRLPFGSTDAIQDPTVAVAYDGEMRCACTCDPSKKPCEVLLEVWRACVAALLSRDPACRPSANDLRRKSKALLNAPCDLFVGAPSRTLSAKTAHDNAETSAAATAVPKAPLLRVVSSPKLGPLPLSDAPSPMHGSAVGSGSRVSNVVFAANYHGGFADVPIHRSPRANSRVASMVSERECHDAITSMFSVGHINNKSLELPAIVTAHLSQQQQHHEPHEQVSSNTLPCA